MNANVLQKSCIRCGLCASLCPEVFTLPDNGEAARVTAEPVPECHEAATQEAADNCPTNAIQIH